MRSLTILLTFLVGTPPLLRANNPQALSGLQQPVAVIVCQYADTEPPVFTSQRWARAFNNFLTPYFASATGQNDSFRFFAVPGVCQFTYTYEETEPGGASSDIPSGGLGSFNRYNDPQVRVREIADALSFAITTNPQIFESNCRVMVIVNRSKRAVSMFPRVHSITLPDGTPGAVVVSAGLICDFSSNIANPPEDDFDGDGVSDADEMLGPDELDATDPLDTGDATNFRFPDSDFDGFLDGVEYDYGSDPNNFINRPRIRETKLSLAAHELAHQFGLPDLYLYPSLFAVQEPIGSWGLMGSHRSQNFSAYSRLSMGWLNFDTDLITINNPVTGPIDQVFTIGSPNSMFGDAEIIQFSIDPTGVAAFPFSYLLEGRSRQSHDARLPDDYEPGVLVSRVSQFLPAVPILQPLSGAPVMSIAGRDCDECYNPEPSPFMHEAALRPGEVYEDKDLNIKFEVVGENIVTGTFDVRVQWQGTPRPDLAVLDGWLDSPNNGFGVFLEPTTGPSGDPLLFGDPVTPTVSISVDSSVFPPAVSTTITPVTHRVFFRVANLGDLASAPITGTLVIADPTVPTDIDLTDPFTWSPATARRIPFTSPALAAGASMAVRIDVPLDRPVMAVLFVDEDPNEINLLNNFDIEPFIVTQISPGSPYEPATVDFSAYNPNANGRFILPTVLDLPNGWSVSSNRDYAFLGNQEATEFQFNFQAPPPNDLKPGHIETIETVGLMNLGDTMAPIGKLPTHIVLNRRTEITLKVVELEPELVTLDGTIVVFESNANGDYNVPTPLPDARILLTAQSMNGFERINGVTSDSLGRFTARVPMRPGEVYHAVAQFAGTIEAEESTSDLVTWGELDPEKLYELTLDNNKILENRAPGTEIGRIELSGLADDEIEFYLASGTGDHGNHLFHIEENALRASEVFDHESLPTTTVRLGSRTSRGFRFVERVFTITIGDDNDEDADNDGISEGDEELAGTSDERFDSDFDGAPDGIDENTEAIPTPDAPEFTEVELFPIWNFVQSVKIPGTAQVKEANETSPYIAGTAEGIFSLDSEFNPEALIEVKGVTTATHDPASNHIYYATTEAPLLNQLDPEEKQVNEGWIKLPSEEASLTQVAIPLFPSFLTKSADGLLLATEPKAGDTLYRFSTTRPDTIQPFLTGAELKLESILDFALTPSGVVILGTDPEGQPNFHSVSADGRSRAIRGPIQELTSAGITYAPDAGTVLLVSSSTRSGLQIHSLDLKSFTWSEEPSFGEFESPTPSAGGVTVSSQGQLVIVDSANETVTVFQREWKKAPELEAPDRRQEIAGSTLRIKGSNLDSIVAFEIGELRIDSFARISPNEVELILPDATPSGVLEFLTPRGQTATDIRIIAASDMVYHPADRAPQDGRITQHELGTYAASWRSNSPWPVAPESIPRAFLDNAVLIWKNGERYDFDASRSEAPDWWQPSTEQ